MVVMSSPVTFDEVDVAVVVLKRLRGRRHAAGPVSPTVVPANVTVVPFCRPLRSSVLPAGTVMPLMVSAVHEDTAAARAE